MLQAWHNSPTRLREDAATEADLVRAGYRDRVFTELAQNAADAAVTAGAPGIVTVWLSGRELHVANIGAPLDVAGVHSLAALRASDKTPTKSAAVGRFGVGFTAVLTISDEIEVRSSSGSIVFSAERTRAELDRRGIAAPVDPPTLRLPWPSHTRPRTGHRTEVVLHLRRDVDAAALLRSIAAEAVELLLELPSIETIRVADTELHRTVSRLPHRVELIAIGPGRWWQYRTDRARWLLPVVDGMPTVAGNDVLRAPTRSDEELSLPAILIADIDMQPDRRRLLPGADVVGLAKGYAKFARALAPGLRSMLVPRPSFARSEVDRLLREALVRELRGRAWVPVMGNTGGIRPPQASVLPSLTDELAELLGDVIPGLVVPALSETAHLAGLAQVGVRRLGLAQVAEQLAGIDREPAWWQRLYAAVEPLVHDRLAAEELGGLPVPLADGRLVTGPRTTVTGEFTGGTAGLPVHWVRLVHPAAMHPLLGRLGAHPSTALGLLSDPALRAELEHAADDAGTDRDLVDAVLSLVAQVPAGAQLPSWLGLLPLPDTDGELRPADELLLPDAPLAQVLADDAPFGTVDPDVVRRYGQEALQAIGAGWGFGIVRESHPTAPDHHLDDESAWWESLSAEPDELVAVRDLDLVDEAAWPQTLDMLADDSRLRPVLSDRAGYTAWWLRRHARFSGQPLGRLRAPDDTTFAGLLDEFDRPDAQVFRAALADPDALDAQLIAVLVQRLADPDRTPTPAIVAETHRRLAGALGHGLVEPADIDLPDRVRAVTGALVDPDKALVLDRPWFAAALPADRLVVGSIATAPDLAALLDLPLASAVVRGEVISSGRTTAWDREPLAVLVQAALDRPLQSETLVLHSELTVRLTGAVEETVRVPFWVGGDGVTHLQQLSSP